MKTRCHHLAIIMLACLLAGCSSPADDAGPCLRQLIQNDSADHIKLLDFTKREGHQAQLSSAENYIVTFEAKIEFEDNGTWIYGLERRAGAADQ